MHTFPENMAISWDWVPVPRKMSLLSRKKRPVVAGVEPNRGTYIFLLASPVGLAGLKDGLHHWKELAGVRGH